MRSRIFTLLAVIGLLLGSFAAGNYASGQTTKKKSKWEFTSIRHSPYLKNTGSDIKKMKSMGAEGWELASSYPVKGEIIISVFKRKK